MYLLWSFASCVPLHPAPWRTQHEHLLEQQVGTDAGWGLLGFCIALNATPAYLLRERNTASSRTSFQCTLLVTKKKAIMSRVTPRINCYAGAAMLPCVGGVLETPFMLFLVT